MTAKHTLVLYKHKYRTFRTSALHTTKRKSKGNRFSFHKIGRGEQNPL